MDKIKEWERLFILLRKLEKEKIIRDLHLGLDEIFFYFDYPDGKKKELWHIVDNAKEEAIIFYVSQIPAEKKYRPLFFYYSSDKEVAGSIAYNLRWEVDEKTQKKIDKINKEVYKLC